MEGNGKTSALLHDPTVLADLYQIADPSVIARIAAKSATIVDLLIEARTHLEQIFGATRIPRLDLKADPENGIEEIIVGIPIINVAADFQLLEKFDQQWWVEAWSRETADICIMLVS